MNEVQSRAKDIMFTDKDNSLISMSSLITRHITLIEKLYNIFKQSDHSKLDKDMINYIEKEHKTLVEKFGAKILKIKRSSRENSDSPYLSQNADFQLLQLKSLLLKERIKL